MKDKSLVFVICLLLLLGGTTVYLLLLQKDVDLNDVILFFKNKKAVYLPTQQNALPQKMKLTSSAFKNGGAIPPRYTCIGADINPPLTIANTPEQARSLAITVLDPDAPYRTWTHWIAYNINPLTTEISENFATWKFDAGKNDFGVAEYRGPCPPLGNHRFIFRVYALDIKLNLNKGASIFTFEDVIEGHVLDTTELLGTFEK